MKSRNRNPIAQAATLEKAREAAFDLIEARADAVADAITEQLSARKLAEYDRAAKQAEALLAEADPDNPARDRHFQECQRARELNRATLPSTIGRERQINPFLRVTDKRVQETASAQGQSDTPLATFTTLRAWKDNF